MDGPIRAVPGDPARSASKYRSEPLAATRASEGRPSHLKNSSVLCRHLGTHESAGRKGRNQSPPQHNGDAPKPRARSAYEDLDKRDHHIYVKEYQYINKGTHWNGKSSDTKILFPEISCCVPIINHLARFQDSSLTSTTVPF